MLPGWREKYDEMKRWRERLAEPMQGLDREAQNLRLLDYLHAFFAASLHLRDWLINDPSHPIPNGTASRVVSRSPSLMLCQAIAVGAKHLRIDDPKLDPNARLSVQTFAQTFGPLKFEASVAEVTASADGYDAIRLADDCIREWDQFLKGQGLL